MRGYFGIGVEGISKPANLGALMRTAHAFGASFVFTIGAAFDAKRTADADTAASQQSVPLHVYPDLAHFMLPEGCQLVGLELVDEAVALPSFRHPTRAAYVLGAERASLSPALIERCDFIVRIPGRFCVNLSVAGAIAMYDRMISLGRFAERPVRAGGPTAPRPTHKHGDPVWKRKQKARAKAAR
ncbi:MAG: RNA methyltransferase [Rhodospirillaceae bacterium]|nr:RNA methyltransferase [Rhodospirillaceae bacterium]